MATTLLSSRLIYQLPNKGTWFENIAVRSNGTILATRVDVPEVWTIDPVARTGAVLLKLPSPTTSTTGITELSPDVFALGAGQYDMAKGAIDGTMEIWVFSLTDGEAAAQATLRLLVKLPDVGLVNGLTKWDSNTVLAVDSSYGGVYKVDVSAKTFSVITSDELTKPGPNAFIPIGINGIKVYDGFIYFTNSARQSFFRIPVDKNTVIPTGPVELVASGFATDDFAFDGDGSAYIVTHPENTIVKIAPGSSEAVTIAGKSDSLEIGGGTSCAFGRKADDAKTLYVVTAGALAMPVNGEIEPAKVVAIDVA